jgi:hypothetical protein
MSARDPEASRWFRLPLVAVAALFLWLVVTQWIDDQVDHATTAEARR